MEIKNLPKQYKKIWAKSCKLLLNGRPGDVKHAMEIVEFVLNYKSDKTLDLSILIPVAMMHDIGHSGILPEHFKYVTGPEKITNGKLAHMLIGAKIAKDILNSVKYNNRKTIEIVEIISMHDAGLLEKINIKNFYNSKNKKIFHDIDSLDRFTAIRLKSISKMYTDKNKIIILLKKSLKSFFYIEFRELAKKRLEELEKND